MPCSYLQYPIHARKQLSLTNTSKISTATLKYKSEMFTVPAIRLSATDRSSYTAVKRCYSHTGALCNNNFDEYSHYDFKNFLRHILSANCGPAMPTEGQVPYFNYTWHGLSYNHPKTLAMTRISYLNYFNTRTVHFYSYFVK